MQLLDINTARDYATKENLLKGLREKGLIDYRFVLVCNEHGRFTAIFPAAQFDGDLAFAAHHGFMVVN